MMPAMPERRTHDYRRNGVTSLFAALNIADGTVITEIRRRHRAVEYKKFLSAIDKAVPDGLEADIRNWIAQWNADPKPFVWTKTAEQVLTSLPKYLQRTCGGEH